MDKVFTSTFCDAMVFPYYKQPHRFYHNEQHIKAMLKSSLIKDIKLSTAQFLAVCFHDAIYIPGNPLNEKESADMMDSVIKQYLFVTQEVDRYELVSALPAARKIILDTKTHDQTHDDSAVVLDLDMEILATDYESEYQTYCANVRLEYGMFSDEQYRIGRSQFLEKTLQQSVIFLTPKFEHLNEIAFSNLRRELISLA